MHHTFKTLVITALAALTSLQPVTLAAQGRPTAPAAYTLGIGDVVSVTVYDQADLTGKFTVAPDGGLTFPLVGRLDAAGRTARDVETDLKARLADGFLKNPQVSLEVLEFRSRRIFVMGAVEKPGPVALTGALTLMEALTAAGGAATGAGTELVLVRAPAGSQPTGPALPSAASAGDSLRYALADVENGTLRENVALRDGDTIFVPRGESIFVLGEVRNPGQVPYQRDMTVLKALSLAGGVTQNGSNGRIKVIRLVDGKQTEVKAKLTDTLRPGDTVTVPTRMF